MRKTRLESIIITKKNAAEEQAKTAHIDVDINEAQAVIEAHSNQEEEQDEAYLSFKKFISTLDSASMNQTDLRVRFEERKTTEALLGSKNKYEPRQKSRYNNYV